MLTSNTIFPTGLAIGFIFRIIYRSNQDSMGIFIIQQLFIVLPPAAFLAGNYIIYGRLIPELGSQFSYIKPSIVSTVFVWSDVITFFIQSGGGGLEASGQKNPSMAKIGSKVSIVDLVL